MKINRIKAKAKKVVITKDNIKDFVMLSNRRDIRRGTVSRLVKILENQEHFETPLMTNIKDGKERLLDGNHRFEAIKEYIHRNKSRRVEVWIFYYKDLDGKREKEIYTKWNLGRKQTTVDFIKQYWDDIPIVNEIDYDDFPYRINYCWASNAIPFKLLIGAYLTKRNKVFNGVYSHSAIGFINEAKRLTTYDYESIKMLLKLYMDAFGNPDKRSMYYKMSVFIAIFRILMDNVSKRSKKDITNALYRLRGCERVVYYARVLGGGSREISIQCRKDLLNVINKRRSKNFFI